MRFIVKAYTKKLREVANSVKKFFSDFRPIWKGPADILIKSTKQLIDTGDSSWQKLAKSTIRWRMAKGYETSPILKASGRLSESFGNVNTQQRKSLTVGTNLPYAAAQQFGSKVHGIPPRPFAVVSDKASSDISEIISDELNKTIQETISKTKEES